MIINPKIYNPKNIFKKYILNIIMTFSLILILSYCSSASQIRSDIRTVNWDKLKENSQHILSLDDDDILANFQYTISLANLGMIEEAYKHIELIKEKISVNKFNHTISPYISKIDIRPNDILLLNYAAFSSSINSNYENAVPYFKRIIELQPKNIWIINFLAATYIELEEYEKAKKEVKKALEIHDNKYSHLILGFIHYNSGNYIKALLELGRSGDLANKILFDN